ncbi:MAG: hypothetical protein OHK0013_12650 [Sandaracinaceae bacterium]
MRPSLRLVAALWTLAASLASHAALPARSRAFCGFYVGGADQRLYANATLVVLMRDGNRTVLSMQNDYQGPPTAFAMVVPVPVVLEEENVRTLPREVFARVDQMAAPRLVEYWEQDPCAPPRPLPAPAGVRFRGGGGLPPTASAELGVTIEAQFAVAEYDIVILSARDSSGLETWLHRERYNIPEGASEVLRPYVESGTKFFVARVDPARVTFENGRAVLSPLRFHYDTPEFSLPVRLGLLSSQGEQDLLVHILARGQRYEVANYANTFIPTNLRVRESVRDHFGAFYESVFRETVARNPRTVVTEYAWDAMSCDPCPGPNLTPTDMMTLGADVTPSREAWGFTLTRLHYRYTRETLGEDLVFRAAPGVVGGRGMPDANGNMEQGVQPSPINNFQGRYAMLHPWTGPVTCNAPLRGQWGGPPDRDDWFAMPPPRGAGSTFARTATPTPPPALASVVEGTLAWSAIAGIQGASPSALVATQAIDGMASAATPPSPPSTSPTTPPPTPPPTRLGNTPAAGPGGCLGACRAAPTGAPTSAVGLLVLALWLARRRAR